MLDNLAAKGGVQMLKYMVDMDKKGNPVAFLVEGDEVIDMRGMTREESLLAFKKWIDEHEISFD